ncbi:transcription factor VOZ1-like [Papaver somniferum]|uniref:transcription factor VOZ1-like n=1 Tax=Papaver somniferum TaxID=3469 RepID=UPI000E702173|nr:transcription factor VOZ1-like [Papaver somniferum]
MKNSKDSGGKSDSHKLFKEKEKNRVDDLQSVITNLQSALQESRSGDVSVLQKQAHQMLREWKDELDEPSPASSSLLGGASLGGTFSTAELCRLLEHCDEEDDATSALKEIVNPNPESQALEAFEAPRLDVGTFAGDINSNLFHDDSYFLNQVPQEHGYELYDQGVGQHGESPSVMQPNMFNNYEAFNEFDLDQFDLHQEFDRNLSIDFDGTKQCGEDAGQSSSQAGPNMRFPTSGISGPKCALWDCTRRAQGSEWYQDYCSSSHAGLAMEEGALGMTPVVRPGIDLKDGPLLAALKAKVQGKDVGIPECEGAATTKCPWNAPELFDFSLGDGETIREWLFFDKPQRAFESGTRKKRSLPDYTGRGWHESRKQQMKEFDGLKRSYYMDPQPLEGFDWHLFEYELNNCDVCALYRLEFKIVDGKKKSPKVKVTNDDPVAHLQKQMGKLTADVPAENKPSVKSKPKGK